MYGDRRNENLESIKTLEDINGGNWRYKLLRVKIEDQSHQWWKLKIQIIKGEDRRPKSSTVKIEDNH